MCCVGQVVVQILVAQARACTGIDGVIVGAGEIVFPNRVAAGSPAVEVNANAHLPIRGGDVLDRVVGTRTQGDSGAALAAACPRQVHIGDQVRVCTRQHDCRAARADGEPLHRAIVGGDGQHRAAKAGSIHLDDRAVHISRLRRPVDDYGIGDGGQGRRQIDGLRSSSADIEIDDVFAGQGIGVHDRLAQRACAAVQRACDREQAGQKPPIFQRLDTQPTRASRQGTSTARLT